MMIPVRVRLVSGIFSAVAVSVWQRRRFFSAVSVLFFIASGSFAAPFLAFPAKKGTPAEAFFPEGNTTRNDSAQIELRATALTVDQGLTQNMVLSVIIDRRGFLWAGTKDGLNLYDGTGFRRFRNRTGDPASLPDNYVQSLSEDSEGRIWVGTGKGLAVFDPVSEKFYTIPDPLPSDSRRNLIRSVAQDGAGTVWACGAKGVIRIEIQPSKKDGNKRVEKSGEHVFPCTVTPVPLPPGSDGVCAALEIYRETGKSDLVYAGNESGLFVAESAPQGVTQPAFERVSGAPVTAMAIDHKGAVWHGKHLLNVYDPDRAASRLFSDDSFIPSMLLRTMAVTPKGEVWIAAGDISGSLSVPTVNYLIDPGKGTLKTVKDLLEKAHLISLFFADNDLLWAGTNGYGLYKIDLKSTQFAQYPTREELNLSAWIESDSHFPAWLPRGSAYLLQNPDGSLRAYSIVKERFVAPLELDEAVPKSSGLPAYFNDQLPPHMTRSPDGRYFVYNFTGNGAEKGLIVYDKSLRPVYTVPFDYEGMHLMYFDFRGQLWLSSAHVLYKYREDLRKLEVAYRLPESGREGVFFTGIAGDASGRLWLGTDFGLTEFNPETGEAVNHRLRNPDLNYGILSMLNDPALPEQFLWVGTEGGGLVRLNKESGKSRRYTESDGLPNMVVYAILPDESGRLWCSTNSGIFNIVPDSRADAPAEAPALIQHFSKEDGLPDNEFNRHFYTRLSDGRFAFESLGGLVVFHPDRVRLDTVPPKMAITDIRLFNRSLPADSMSGDVAGAERSLSLPWRDNVLSFHYAALDFRAPEKLRYRTKLEGVDKEWSTPTPMTVATYANLKPGNYTFRVQGTNSNGVWNEAGISVPVEIRAPWWLTGPAYAIYFLLAAGVVVALYRFRINRLRLRYSLENQSAEAARLQEVDQMKNVFFSNITHEFRTPLTLIISPLEKMLTRVKEDEYSSELRRIHRNANHLLRLINQLLDLSKIDSGLMPVDPARGEAAGFLSEITDSFRSLAESRHIELKFHSEPDRFYCMFDPGTVEKIVYNLVYNAIKFTPKSGRVSVAVRYESEALIIEVSDTGEGISEENRNRIFDRYYSGHDPRSGSSSGTGIGLALVRELTLLCGGTVEVESEPGQGSTFTVTLPSASAEISDIAEPAHALLERVPPDDDRDATEEAVTDGDEKPLILIAEDNEDLRSFVAACLNENYRIIEAADGKEALEAAIEYVPDAVVCDVMMPVMDGFEFLDACKSTNRTSHIPVVMLTAKTNRKDREAGLLKGAEAYLTKPFYETELLALLHNLLEARVQSWKRYRNEVSKEREKGKQGTEAAFIAKFRGLVEADLSNSELDVEYLCREVGMSRTQLHRKVKALTGMSAGQFVRHIRLEHARRMIESDSFNVSEVAYRCGFNSHSYFSKCFAEAYGKAPVEYRAAFEG